jgi:hypothetical protein
MLTVRCSGSQMVGFIEVPLALGEPGCCTPCGPQIGAVGPKVILPGVGVHLAGPSSVQLKCGMGPRVLPSHSSHPIAHPLENLCGRVACRRSAPRGPVWRRAVRKRVCCITRSKPGRCSLRTSTSRASADVLSGGGVHQAEQREGEGEGEGEGRV